MGCGASSINRTTSPRSPIPQRFAPIADRFTHLTQVQAAVREAGLESSNLILGIDYTKSNTWTGRETFDGRNLHDISSGIMNPYQRVIDVLGRTLEEFDDDKLIPCFGFGDMTTSNKACFPFNPGNVPCEGVSDALRRYVEVAGSVQLAGPTCFAPVIYQAIDIVRREQAYHILVIVADGQVTDASPQGETAQAIIEASNYPLSIIVVGVGDGPWHEMEHYDDELPQRRFDNFQFVDFHSVCRQACPASVPRGQGSQQLLEARFALAALMEIPDQYAFIKQAGLLSTQSLAREPLGRAQLMGAPPVPASAGDVAMLPLHPTTPVRRSLAAGKPGGLSAMPGTPPPAYSLHNGIRSIPQGYAAPAAE